jgi:O-antigen ligase
MVANAVLTIFFGIVARPDLPGSPFTQIGAGNQVGFSLSINFALSLLLAYVITPKRWRIVERPVADWLVTIVLLAGVLTVAVLNGKRGGILSPFIAVLFLLPLVTARTLRGLSKHLVLLAFIVIGLSIPVQLMVLADLLQSVGSDLVPERFKVPVYMAADFFGLYEYRGGYDPSNDARIAIFRQAIETIVQHPVFGSGVFSIQQHGLGYAHSIFLELWLEGGLVLLVSFLALFIYVVVLGVRQAVHSRFAQAAILFLGGMGGTFVHMWTALTLYEGKMLWLGLGGIVGIELLRRRHRSIPKRARAIRQSAGAVPTTPAAALNVGTGRATAGE